jgi:predicted O-methyltransferase YrrM
MQFDIEAIIKESKDVSYNFKSDILKKLDVEYSKYFMQSDGEQYRLLTAIAKLYPEAQFVDLGTFTGASAIAYLYGNPQKPVYSYDMENSHRFIHDGLLDRIILKKEDCRTADFKALGKIDVILLDISHNGDDEAVALRNLDAQGILNDAMIIFDDIILNDAKKRLWAGVSGKEGIPSKFDITPHGHASGTGILLV